MFTKLKKRISYSLEIEALCCYAPDNETKQFFSLLLMTGAREWEIQPDIQNTGKEQLYIHGNRQGLAPCYPDVIRKWAGSWRKEQISIVVGGDQNQAVLQESAIRLHIRIQINIRSGI